MPTPPPPLPTVLASGAWLKNTACLLQDGVPRWSAPHGDLDDPAACEALEASLRSLCAQAGPRIDAIAHDLHPDFYSTRIALALADELDVPAIGVQHHHAHIGAVLAEHRVDEPAIGLALDGVGLGTDGQAWGGELLHVERGGWRRLGQLWPLALPGGDAAAREPWRMAASALHALGRGAEIEARFAPRVGAVAARGVQRMLDQQLNCPASSSTGRWFDAAAGALDLSLRQAHEAQAAMALEALAAGWLAAHADPAHRWSDTLSRELIDRSDPAQLDLRPLLARLLDTPRDPAALAEAAARFHLLLADALADWAADAAHRLDVEWLCLGGGCFANRLLADRIETRARRHGLRVLRVKENSCGDAGLALGQAWVAAQQIRSGLTVVAHGAQFACA